MLEPGKAQQRINIPFFEGVNSLVGLSIGKKTELAHAENARSKIIGTIEKREGQTVLGTNVNGVPFVTTANYGIFYFQNSNNQGLYRISVSENPDVSVNVSDTVMLADPALVADAVLPLPSNFPFTLAVSDHVGFSDYVNGNTNTLATIYSLDSENHWVPLTGEGTGFAGGNFTYAKAEGCMFLVNQNADNRYIDSTGTVITSSTASGHLFNTPPASIVNYYKNRLYLADYVRGGIRYKGTILRSSYPMGIISLINNDYTTLASGSSVDVTDTKYFYSDSGANTYDIYRGSTLIKTITATSVNETSITGTWSGTLTVLASDEIWISGTYGGSKVFRWVSNPTVTGRDVKQYDTFKLSGGEDDEVTMMTNIGNVMLTSSKSSMAAWNDYTLENFDLGIGCVSKRGWTKLLGSLYFMGYTGIYSTTGGVPKLISNKVERYITGATKAGKEACAAGKKGRSIFFAIGTVTLYRPDGSVNKILPDVCLEYNLTQENWFVHTNVKATEFATFIEGVDSDRLMMTDSSGNHAVKEFLSGETDDGAAIHFRADTMKLTVQPTNFEYSSKLIAVLEEIERGASIQTFASIDTDEDFYPLEGTAQKGLSIIKVTGRDTARGKPPYGRIVSFSFRDSSIQTCKIARVTIVHLPTTDENLEND